MADIKYIRYSTTLHDDEKIKLIEKRKDRDAILVIWDKCLCFAGRTNDGGWIHLEPGVPYSDEDLVTLWNRPASHIKSCLETLAKYKLVELSNKGILVRNFGKWQPQGMSDIKEQNRKRQQRYRDRHKIKPDAIVEPFIEAYNALDIGKVASSTNGLKAAVSDALERYTQEDLIRALQNYAEIIKHPDDYYYDHIWTLQDFLTKNGTVEKFLDLAIAQQNYRHKGKNKRDRSGGWQ